MFAPGSAWDSDNDGCDSTWTGNTASGNIWYTITPSGYNSISEAFDYDSGWRDKIRMTRASWPFIQYLPRIKKAFLKVRIIHRKAIFSLSGWLGRKGKKLRRGW